MHLLWLLVTAVTGLTLFHIKKKKAHLTFSTKCFILDVLGSNNECFGGKNVIFLLTQEFLIYYTLTFTMQKKYLNN